MRFAYPAEATGGFEASMLGGPVCERELGMTDGTCGWSFASFERPLRLGGPLSCLCLFSWASRDLLVGLW